MMYCLFKSFSGVITSVLEERAGQDHFCHISIYQPIFKFCVAHFRTKADLKEY